MGSTHLQQHQTERHKPISYWTRSLRDAERSYGAWEIKCLADIWDVLLLRPYLEGAWFKTQADHDDLCWMLALTHASDRLANFRLRFSKLEIDVVHSAGAKKEAVSGRLWLPAYKNDTRKLNDASTEQRILLVSKGEKAKHNIRKCHILD